MKTICIRCPLGCPLTAEMTDEGLKISGNSCKRGEKYGKEEFTSPKREITTLIKLENGSIASVKTSDCVPKERIFDVIKAIGMISPEADVKVGDTVITDLLGLGVDVIVTGINH